MNTRFLLILLSPILLAGSCNFFQKKNDEGQEKPLARVHDQYLYPKDVAAIFSNITTGQDSTELLKKYIDNWVRQQLVLKVAERYLPSDKADIERQITDYRHSLIIYIYENELVKQKLDTVVTDAEIEKYYEEFKSSFDLRQPVLQLNYVILKPETPKLDSARIWFRSLKDEDRYRLMDYCYQYALDFFMKDDTWLEADKVLRQLPIDERALDGLMRYKTSGEFNDSLFVYMVKVNDFRNKGELAPLAYVRDDIYKLIINRRKMELINNTHRSIYEEALKNDNFEVF